MTTIREIKLLEPQQIIHCVKSVQMGGFFWSVFSLIWTFPSFSPNAGKYGPEKTPYLDTFHAVFMLEKGKHDIHT